MSQTSYIFFKREERGWDCEIVEWKRRFIIQRNMRIRNVNGRYVRAQCQQFLNAREK